MSSTRELAKFAISLKYENLTEDVLAKSKMCLLDTLGTALFGSRQIAGKTVAEFVEEMDSKEESTVVGNGKACATHASLANGTMAHSFELDDAYSPAIHHPGSVVVPAALSVGEREGSDGKEIIAAIVAGYEVMNRIGESLAGANTMRGFFATGTNGPFGAAVAAGRLLGLDENEMVSALGIAGSQGAGLLECLAAGGMTKRLGAGIASQSGVLSALLAQKGFTGPATIIEGKYGYCKVYSDKCDLSKLTRNIGKDYSILSTSFKLYPCCKGLHATLDAVLQLVKEHNLESDMVREITVGGPEKFVNMHANYEPLDILAAQFSLPYTIGAAFLRKRLSPEEFTAAAIRDSMILEFAKRIKIIVDPELAPLWPKHVSGKVTIRLKDGKEHSKTVIDPKGDPRNPVSSGELEQKFRCLSSGILKDSQISDLIEKVYNLEVMSNITQLTEALGD